METLAQNEYASFYQPYITVVLSKEMSLLNLLEYSLTKALTVLNPLSKEKQDYRYASGKWSIKEIVQHLIDAERIFTYRALRFARFDKTDLPGFEENSYVDNSFCDEKDYAGLLEEFIVVRRSTQMLFKNFSSDILKNQGLANGSTMSVRAIGYVITGHQLHHLNVIKERYL